MKINIEINCDDDLQDIKTHLSVIRERIVQSYRKTKESPYGPIVITDDNCYGWYEIKLDWE